MELQVGRVEDLHGLPFLITTIRRPTSAQVEEAQALAERTGQPYLDRELGSLTTLYDHAIRHRLVPKAPTGILVVRQHDYIVWLPHGDPFEYHPGMAVHRIKVLAKGGRDPMIEAMQLGACDRVLDCTAGLCSDALVASSVVGALGEVSSVERSLPVALTVAKGLSTYVTDRKGIEEPMRRIRLVAEDAANVLRRLDDEAYDVVYFDPMFDDPVVQSTGIAPLRHLADPTPLSEQILVQAARVAKRAVVVKDRTHGPWARDARITRFVGSPKRRVGYAVFEGTELRSLMEAAT